MKKTCLVLIALLSLSFIWGQGLETFDNLGITGTSYQDGTFLGQDGSTWTFWQCRGDYEITGKAIMIGRNRNPQSEVFSGTISGGIGVLNFDYMQAFGTNVDLNVEINGDVVANFTSSGQQGVVLNSGDVDVNVDGNFVIRFINRINSGGQVVIDNVEWTGYGEGAIPPSISNIVHVPETDITSTTSVSVSADVDEGDEPIDFVELRWGTSSGDYPNTITMSSVPFRTSGNYITISNIPAQDDGTTVYYVIYAEDVEEEFAISAEQSYTVTDPATTNLPYEETFDSDLGDCYVYSVSGPTRVWNHHSGNETAQMNGFGSSELEEDWLILPGVTLDEDDVILTFDTWRRYGEDDVDNYFQLLYSSNYPGLGDPSGFTWTPLAFNMPTEEEEQVWTSSGDVDLSEIVGDPVYIAFKYHYNVDKYVWWQVDNINILEADTPMLSVVPDNLSGFTYVEGDGPSDPQSFELSGDNLNGDDVTVTAPAGFQVSESESGSYGVSVVLTAYDGSATDIWVRLAIGLEVDDYSGNVVISGGGATDETVAVSGEVTPVPPENILFSTNFGVPENWTDLPPTSWTGYNPKEYAEGGWYFYSPETTRGTAAESYDGSLHSFRDRVEFTVYNTVAISNMTGFSMQLRNWMGTAANPSSLERDVNVSFNGGVDWTTIATLSQDWFQEPPAGEYEELFYDFSARGVHNFAPEEFQLQIVGGVPTSNDGRINIGSFEAYSDIIDDELPVELSSFTASITANRFVQLKWVSETETNLSGYNVFRNTNDTLAEAVLINTEMIPATNTSTQQTYEYVDEQVNIGDTYFYWLQSNDLDLTSNFHGPVSIIVEEEEPDTPSVPLRTELLGAFPNPFNPDTRIAFTLDSEAKVKITVFNVLGQQMQVIADGTYPKGQHTAVWNGQDQHGRTASSGVYFYKMETDSGYEMIKKMALIK